MMRVQNETSKVESFDDAMLVKKLTKEVKELKQELLMHDAMVERSGVVYDDYTPEQKLELREKIQKFLTAELGSDEEYEAISLSSVRQMREILNQFKRISLEKDVYIKRAVTAAQSQPLTGGMETGGAESKGEGAAPSFGDAKDAVGDLVGGDGFALGMAGGDLRPSQMDDLAGSPPRGGSGFASPGRATGGISYEAQSKAPTSTTPSAASPPREFKGSVPEDKEEAFALYKRTQGKSDNLELLSLKADVKSLKGKAKALASECNDYKREIDRLSSAIASKKAKKLTQMQPGGYEEGVEVVDEEEVREPQNS